MRTVAVVLAGGTGQRFGSGKRKQLHVLTGKPLLAHSVAAFQAAPGIDAVLLVMARGFAAEARSQFSTARYSKVVDVIDGGRPRADSAPCAVAALARRDCHLLLHDAARPLVDQRI